MTVILTEMVYIVNRNFSKKDFLVTHRHRVVKDKFKFEKVGCYPLGEGHLFGFKGWVCFLRTTSHSKQLYTNVFSRYAAYIFCTKIFSALFLLKSIV